MQYLVLVIAARLWFWTTLYNDRADRQENRRKLSLRVLDYYEYQNKKNGD
jgi:hypothetical protein